MRQSELYQVYEFLIDMIQSYFDKCLLSVHEAALSCLETNKREVVSTKLPFINC